MASFENKFNDFEKSSVSHSSSGKDIYDSVGDDVSKGPFQGFTQSINGYISEAKSVSSKMYSQISFYILNLVSFIRKFAIVLSIVIIIIFAIFCSLKLFLYKRKVNRNYSYAKERLLEAESMIKDKIFE